jgi:hypothetical protein
MSKYSLFRLFANDEGRPHILFWAGAIFLVAGGGGGVAGEVVAGEVVAGEVVAGEVVAGEVVAGEVVAVPTSPNPSPLVVVAGGVGPSPGVCNAGSLLTALSNPTSVTPNFVARSLKLLTSLPASRAVFISSKRLRLWSKS